VYVVVFVCGVPCLEDMLRRRAQLPPTKDFTDALQKFKLAFNLLVNFALSVICVCHLSQVVKAM